MTAKEGAQTRAMEISVGWAKHGDLEYLIIETSVITLKAVHRGGA